MSPEHMALIVLAAILLGAVIAAIVERVQDCIDDHLDAARRDWLDDLAAGRVVGREET